jgi:hypothetical protein
MDREKNKHMVTRIEIVPAQQAILQEAAHLAQLVAHYQVLVQWQQFFTSFCFIWEQWLCNVDQLTLKHQTRHVIIQQEIELRYTINESVIRALFNWN